MSDLVGNQEDRFSHEAAHFISFILFVLKLPTVNFIPSVQQYDLSRNVCFILGSVAHTCSVCKKAFISNAALKRHLQKHKGIIDMIVRLSLLRKTILNPEY